MPEAAHRIVSSWRHKRPFGRRCGLDQIGILSVLSPTHTPPPLSRPAGRKRGASCGRVFEGGKSEFDFALPSKWLQRKPEAHRSISAQHQRTLNGLKRLKRLNGLQQFENPLNPFDGNAPMRAFFPPLKTRPNVAVSSLSAPAGVERVGVRGGIQRKRNKNAANSQPSQSGRNSHRVQEPHQKTEHITNTGRGLEAKNTQTNAVSPTAGPPATSRPSNP